MARPQKAVVDYFPHVVKHGKSMLAIESRFGNDGYAFWFKLLEVLGETEGHVFDCNNPVDVEYLLAKTHITEVAVFEILDLLAKIDSIDQELWNKKIIWCQNFVDGVTDAYKRRKVGVPSKPGLCMQKPNTSELMSTETPLSEVNVNINPQSKVKKSKVNKNKKETLIDFYFNLFLTTFGKKPSINGGKDGSIFKKLLDTYPEEQIKELLEKFFVSDDKFIKGSGYTVGVFSSVINKLLIESTSAKSEPEIDPGRERARLILEEYDATDI